MSKKRIHRSGIPYLLSAISATLVLSMISRPFHFTDVFLEEDSKLRLAML